MNKLLGGSVLAVGAASLFALAPAFASMTPGAPMVQCVGGNSCKGQSTCHTATNSCKGQNSCKGKGVISMSKEDCDTAGGTVGTAE